MGEYSMAQEHLEKSLAISKEIGDRNGEASCYSEFAGVYQSVGEYCKAIKQLENSLAISIEIGDRNGESLCYGNLGIVYESIGKYDEAREHLEKSLAIFKEIGDVRGEPSCYGMLGAVYQSVGEYDKAENLFKKILAITRKICDRHGEAFSCQRLGAFYYSVGKYDEANQYNQEGFVITREIGARREEAFLHEVQGAVFASIGDFIKAEEHLKAALAISKEIGHRSGEAQCCLDLGTMLLLHGDCVRAEEYVKNALAISEGIGHVKTQLLSLQSLAQKRVHEKKIQEAIFYFLASISKCEKMRGSLRDNDEFKLSFSDHYSCSYQDLCTLLCETGNSNAALHVSELRKARALADLMSARYSVKNPIIANLKLKTWADIESIMDKEPNSSCLYLSYSPDSIYFWVLKAGGGTHFRKIKGNEIIAQEEFCQTLNELFASESFRSFGILPEVLCEDRSLNFIQEKCSSCKDDSHEALRIGNESKDNKGPKMNLSLCYNLIVAPVADLLEGPEVIIVPDRSLYNIPFAALPDESGQVLSETFSIRVVPSLTTLRLNHDSPADYHSQTGALIVGNPEVGRVLFKGCLTVIPRLPYAEKEAKMVGKKLRVEPLLGQQATKQAVLQAMRSVGLIHFAAHGDAERGEIALAPSFPKKKPREEDYLLTMSDISKVHLRAKLVVLSCCHSARGPIKAEGAVGIARAFLGSGARSVLVALWAIEDSATE